MGCVSKKQEQSENLCKKVPGEKDKRESATHNQVGCGKEETTALIWHASAGSRDSS